MPRRKRRDKAFDFEIATLEREMTSLGQSTDYLAMRLTPFRPHYDALRDLNRQMRRTLNVLKDRDPDYVEPHQGHMARG